MSKEKYYTPNPEEFCIGFEYETLVVNSTYQDVFFGELKDLDISYAWDKCCFPDPFSGYDLEKLFKQKIRVKCLNEEDIESLGFTNKKSINIGISNDEFLFSDEFYLDIDNDLTCELYLNRTEMKENVTISLCSKELARYGEYSDDEYVYEINVTIKNKSELKKLLKQLGIINE